MIILCEYQCGFFFTLYTVLESQIQPMRAVKTMQDWPWLVERIWPWILPLINNAGPQPFSITVLLYVTLWDVLVTTPVSLHTSTHSPMSPPHKAQLWDWVGVCEARHKIVGNRGSGVTKGQTYTFIHPLRLLRLKKNIYIKRWGIEGIFLKIFKDIDYNVKLVCPWSSIWHQHRHSMCQIMYTDDILVSKVLPPQKA